MTITHSSSHPSPEHSIFANAFLLPQRSHPPDIKFLNIHSHPLHFIQIIERLVQENVAGGEFMLAALALIRSSRFGLFESELVQLLALKPSLPSENQLSGLQYSSSSVANDQLDRINTQNVALLWPLPSNLSLILHTYVIFNGIKRTESLKMCYSGQLFIWTSRDF